MHARARAYHANVRSALENARLVLADARRPRQGRSPRGEQLLVLTEGAEQLFGTLVAIDAELEACARERVDGRRDRVRPGVHLARDHTRSARRCDGRYSDRSQAGRSECRPRSRSSRCRRLAERASALGRNAAVPCRRGCDACSSDAAAKINARASGVVTRTAEHPAFAMPKPEALAWLRPLREALTSRSLPARHGLRMGIAAALAVWLSFALDITRGYWATITTLIVLQPYTGATMRKTLQRVGGSVLGGILAAALAVAARTKLAIAGIMVPFTIAAVAVLPLNYGVFVLLLTPVFVLLAEPHPGDWELAGLRAVNTLLGGVIALAAAQLLWPVHELSTYAGQLADLFRELRTLVATATADPTAPQWKRSVDDARRRFGVAVTNAEATMQRLITEDSPNPRRVEAAMTVTTYGRRMASTLSALAEARARDAAPMQSPESPAMLAQLDTLIASLADSRSWLATPPIATVDAPRAEMAAAPSLQAAQIERLRAQLAVLERAVARYKQS